MILQLVLNKIDTDCCTIVGMAFLRQNLVIKIRAVSEMDHRDVLHQITQTLPDMLEFNFGLPRC